MATGKSNWQPASKVQALEEVASLWANYWLSERLDESKSADLQISAA